MARNISCEGKKRQGGFARWMWSIRDLVARHGVFGLRFRRHYSHTLSRNIWKKHCHIGDSITVVFTLSLYAKYFHTLPGHLLGRNNKKAHTWRACTKKQILQNLCSRNAGLAGHQLLKHHRVGGQKAQGKGLLRFNPAQVLPLGTTGLTGKF